MTTATSTVCAPNFTTLDEGRYPLAMGAPEAAQMAEDLLMLPADMRPRLADDEYRELVRIFFINGQCHALALCIVKLTGWKAAGCNYAGTNMPGHVFALTPDGRSLDIYGVHAKGEHPDDSMDTDWTELSIHQLRRLHSRGYYRPQLEVAMPYAEKLVTYASALTPTSFSSPTSTF